MRVAALKSFFLLIVLLTSAFSLASCGDATTTDSTAPSVPTGLIANAVSSSEIDLSWNASTDNVGVAGYKIYSGAYVNTATGTSFSDIGLNASTNYCYTVSAYDAAGNESAQSSQVCATSLALVGSGSKNFTDNGDGTITDNVTGLMWQKCSCGQNNDAACSGSAGFYNWDQASSICGSLTLGGHTDWWLPDVRELFSIVDFAYNYPTINTTYFPNTMPFYYWSSTASASNPSIAWPVYFNGGYITGYVKTDNFFVRCARLK